MITCNQCDEEITFDDYHIGRNGKKVPLDPDTNRPHQCSAYENDYEPPTCKYCSEEITFSQSKKGKNGRMIPLDPDTDQPHRCEESFEAWKRAHPVICKKCNKTEIFFSDKNMSVSGKFIPMEVETGEPHNCPMSKYHKNDNWSDFR